MWRCQYFYDIISYHIISYHIMSYILSYHIISYHIYHMISPMQKWLRERARMLPYTYIACLFINEPQCVYCAVRIRLFSYNLVWYIPSTFVVDNKMAPRHVFPPVLLFPHVGFIVILPDEQMDEAWEPSKKQCTLGNRGVLDRTVGYFRFASV